MLHPGRQDVGTIAVVEYGELRLALRRAGSTAAGLRFFMAP
jgi:hypothetical protein